MAFGLSATAIATIGGSLLGAGANIYSANKAANAQQQSSDQANATAQQVSNQQIALQKDQFDKNYAMQQPIYADGTTARNRLMQLYGLTPGGEGNGSAMRNFSAQDFQQDPGYQFRMDQGQQALERSAASRGGLLSGAAAKDTMRFSQGLGSQEYGAAYDRFQTNRANQLNPLQSLANNAQTAAGTLGAAGQNYANSASSALGQYGQTVGNNLTGMGNVRASGYLATGNALTNMFNQGVSAFKGSGNYQSQPMMSKQPFNGNVGDFNVNPTNRYMG